PTKKMVGLKKREREDDGTSKLISWRFGPIFWPLLFMGSCRLYPVEISRLVKNLIVYVLFPSDYT
ncbi:hypothetical protein, partial [Staphylococcus haemolyticus]|uniref:hypothetical protein n=1 Tax=Staphylococcus haemolyticus TaxID=1283 RepID=UPI001C92BB4C